MMKTIAIAPGINLRAMQTDKFKTACFSVNFLRPHNADDASADALLPSVLLRATERYPDIRSISMQLDALYGATIGTLIRRKGEVKLVGFYADFVEDAFLPEGESVFAPVLDMIEELLYHPLTGNGVFCKQNVEGEKQNLINAIESEMNDKRTYAVAQMLRSMCKDEAYGVPRLGRADDVRAITPQSLWEHYQNVLKTSRIELFYAGRKSPEEAAEAFRTLFAGKQPECCVPVETKVIRTAEKVCELSQSMDVTQGKLVIGLRTGITVEDADYPALLLLNAVYGAGVTSKLFVNVREKLSLCYYASSSLEKYKGVMVISSGVDFQNFETAKTAILKELDDCKQGVISSEELESARRTVLSALRASQDAPVQLDEFYMGAAIAKMDDFARLTEKVEALTAADLTAAARKLTVDTIYFLKGEAQ